MMGLTATAAWEREREREREQCRSSLLLSQWEKNRIVKELNAWPGFCRSCKTPLFTTPELVPYNHMSD